MVGEERPPVCGDGEPLRGRVARDELRRVGDSGATALAAETATARATPRAGAGDRPPNPVGAVSAPDPDVERFLLTLQARRSPRTVDATAAT